MHTDEKHTDLTESVIGCAFEVANVLGAGFLEKVYERALMRELTLRGIQSEQEVHSPVRHKGLHVGDYVADLVVEKKLIVELKCAERLVNQHLAQCINYLKAAKLGVALLINFQRPRLEWKRVLMDP